MCTEASRCPRSHSVRCRGVSAGLSLEPLVRGIFRSSCRVSGDALGCFAAQPVNVLPELSSWYVDAFSTVNFVDSTLCGYLQLCISGFVVFVGRLECRDQLMGNLGTLGARECACSVKHLCQ